MQTTIITPNSRLSAVTLQNYNQQQVQTHSTWESMDCLPLVSWLQRLWLTYCFTQEAAPALLLTPEQEQFIWEDIITASPQHAYLLQIVSAAELAKSAWHTLKLWQVDLNHPALPTTDDAQTFLQWAQAFHQRCNKQGWLDTSSMIETLIPLITHKKIILPEQILLSGFTEISPLHQKLFLACEQQGCRVTKNIIQVNAVKHQRIALSDMESEMRTMARWAKKLYDENPEYRIGCVIPHLEDERDKIIRIFSEVFAKDNTFTLNYTLLPFNISAGKSLASYPIIHTAIELLKITTQAVSINTLLQLLHSPFLGEAEQEMQARAQLCLKLQKDNINQIEILQFAQNYKDDCPAFSARILNVINSIAISEQNLPVRDWATFFMEQLSLWGWPGERSVDSFEYQTIQAWIKTFTDFSMLNSVLDKLSYKKALQNLIYLTAQKVFQPESPPATIQILGMLEAAEIPFDYLWVMGMDDSAWPQSPNPNPFIPQHLQKKLKMPHANADRELEYGIQLTQQLKSCAPHIIFSYAQQNDDAELRPSPIITDLPEIKINELSLFPSHSFAQTVLAAQKTELIHDEIAPAIKQEDIIRGGTSIFKWQAACPFRAFAELRLQAQRIDPPVLGLRATDKGEIIHKVMEILWSDLQNQANLLKCSEIELENKIKLAIEQALTKVKRSSSNERYIALEALRLQRLIRQWLEQEKLRPPFQVAQLEHEIKLAVNGITARFRLDRIDRLENGDEIIIDYKTGKTSPAQDWFSKRPNEPQLPLYASLLKNAQGILFAQINAEEMKWKGVSANDLSIKHVKTIADDNSNENQSWPEQLNDWQRTLEQLASDFAQGKALRDPKNELATCQYCHLKQLCRLHETINEVPQ